MTDKFLKGSDTLKQAYPKINDAISRIDNIASQAGSDNTEIVDARYSTVKNKTFNILSERLNEGEQDTVNLNTRITTIENQNLDTRITTIENQNLDTRVTTAENKITTLENDINSPEYSEPLTQSTSIFTAGTGKNESGQDVDVSSSIVEGQVSEVRLKGNTMNILLGENFQNDFGGFTSTYGTIASVNGELEYTVSSLSSAARINKDINVVIGHKYYISAQIRPKYSNNTRFSLGGVYSSYMTPTANINNKISAILEPSNNTEPFRLYHDTAIKDYSIGDKVYFDDIMIIDLTANGLDNLTKEECDARFGFMTTGTKSTVSSIRLMGTNKNQWRKGLVEYGAVAGYGADGKWNYDDTITLDGQYQAVSNTLKVVPNTEYTLSLESEISAGTVKLAIDGTYITQWTTNERRNFNFTSNNQGIVKIDFYTASNPANIKIKNIMLALASVDQTYIEPITDNKCYIYATDENGDVIEMHSLDNDTNDEVYEENGQYKVRKNVSFEYILQNTDFQSLSTNLTNVDLIIFSKYPALDEYIDYDVDNRNATNMYLYGYSPLRNGTIDDSNNVWKYYKNLDNWVLIVPKGYYADLASAQADLAGTSLIYQLAPEYVKTYDLNITPLDVYPNGTIIIEPYLRKTLQYDGTTGNGLDFPIKVSEIEKIKDALGNEIDLTNITLASDGMSATITGAVDGEEYVVYAYIDTTESTIPESVLTYPMNSKAQILNNNASIQQHSKAIIDLQDKVDILLLNAFN